MSASHDQVKPAKVVARRNDSGQRDERAAFTTGKRLAQKLALPRRGFFFTLDAILAASLLLLVILIIPKVLVTEAPIIQTSYEATDIANLLSVMLVNEVDTATMDGWIATGVVTNTNQSVLEQIGEFWARDDNMLAQNLTRQVLDGLVDSYQLFVDDENITGTTANAKQVVSSRRMVSGITKGREKLGFSARAYATKAKKNNVFILLGDIMSGAVKKVPSGNNQNEVNSTYTFTLPDGATVTDAYWFVEAAWTDNKFKAYLNGDLIPGSDATGSKLMTDLESYILPGTNTASVIARFGASGPDAGEDGASHLVVTYTTETPSTLENLNKKYFAYVGSNSSIRYKKPVFTLGNVASMDVELDILGTNATLGIVVQGTQYNVSRKNATAGHISWSSSEILTNLTNNGLSFANLTGQYFWIAIDVGMYKAPENLGPYRAILSTSYVEIETDQTEEIYGKLDLTTIVPVFSYSSAQSGSFYRTLDWKYNISPGTTPLMTDSQLAWLYSSGTDPSQNASSNAVTLYKHPTQPLIKEFARMGFSQSKGAVVNGSNTYKLRFGSGYGVDPFNSLVFTTALVDTIVPYGNAFDTEDEAVADAIERLKEQLGQFINASEIGTDTAGLSNVPSLWGPAIVEVRAWR
ncbi:hypothetical protein HY492_02925 [Candidatus Woesearchaeota archaeon]|nr:hypothetical protein [Candidatus Woesearchaeota archaeon]